MVKVKPVQNGRTTRMSFSHINEVIGMPNLIEIQKNSYNWFLEEGLHEVFHDIAAIEDYTGNLVLEFVDYRLDKNPKYSIKECKERDATYAAPLYVTARLFNKQTGEVKEQEIFMGDFPLMTDAGTFISNGAERAIVSLISSKSFTKTLSDLKESIVDKAGDTFNNINLNFDTNAILKDSGNFFTNAWNAIAGFFGAIWNAIVKFFSGLVG